MRGRGRALRAEAEALRIAERPPHPSSPRAAGRGGMCACIIALATRSCVRALPTTKQIELAPGNKRGRRSAERRMPTIDRACADKCTRSAPLICCAAARHIGARPPSGASTAALAGTPIPAQLQAMFPGTWTAHDPEKWIPVFRKDQAQLKKPAGVTRPILSQSSDSTSRLGRSTEGPDARSRSGADCEPARKHRTRPTLRIASGMRPLE